LAQALVAQSAAMMASRASMKVGLTGVILSPSMTIWSVVWLPVGTSPLAPAGSAITRARTPQSVSAQISPALWTSMPPFRLKVIGVGVMPPLRSLVMSSTSAQVIGLTLWSVV
jgi:hypothetical protein